MADHATATRHTREVKGTCDKIHLFADGQESSHPGPDETGLMFAFANGRAFTIDVTKLPGNIQTILMWHGAAQKLGDAYAKGKGTPLADRIENFEAVLERLGEGEWVRKGEATGPRTSILFEAVVRVLEKRGETVDDARKESIRRKLADAATRKATLANKDYAKAYDDIRIERIKAQAKERGETAEAAPEF